MASIMTVRPPDVLRQQLKRSASERGISLNALILQILWEWAQKNAPTEEEGGRRK